MDLICAIATPTAQTMANATKDIPIVATAVTDYEVAKLAASNNEPKGNVTGTSDMNPIDQQLELLLKIAPQTKNIGTVYSSSEVNSQLQVDVLKKLAGDKASMLSKLRFLQLMISSRLRIVWLVKSMRFMSRPTM